MNRHAYAYSSPKPSCERRARAIAGWTVATVLAALLPSGAVAQVRDSGPIAYSKASLFFELNHTDGDLGIQAALDGDPWHRLTIEDASGERMLDIEVKGRLRSQGLSEISYESAEPPFDKLAPADFFRRFSEGDYKIKGTTLDGKRLAGTAKLSHVIPAPPGNILVSGVAVPNDCAKDPIPSVGKPVVISWNPVTTSHPEIGKSGSIAVSAYQLVVEREKPSELKLSVDLPPTVRSFEVPKDFIDLDGGEGFKIEILVAAANGNLTASESCFKLK
jgi:hypothetical protein